MYNLYARVYIQCTLYNIGDGGVGVVVVMVVVVHHYIRYIW